MGNRSKNLTYLGRLGTGGGVSVGGGGVPERTEFLRLFVQNYPSLSAFVRAAVRDPSSAEDVLQDVVLALTENIERYDPARPFSAWARGVALKKIKQFRSGRSKGLVLLSSQALEALAAAYGRTETDECPRMDALRQCMDRLDRRQRHLLSLRYEYSLPLKEIAERVGSTLDAVHKALARLRARLAECVESKLKTLGRIA